MPQEAQGVNCAQTPSAIRFACARSPHTSAAVSNLRAFHSSYTWNSRVVCAMAREGGHVEVMFHAFIQSCSAPGG